MRISCIFSFLSVLDTLILVHEVLWPFIDIHCTYFPLYIVDVCFSFTYPLICCFFSLFIHMLLINLYAIYYFYFTQRCLNEFCLKYFRNTGCQSLLAINSLLAKFFKSLCYDRFYCIQQVNMSWVIYEFSRMFICLLWFCHRLPKGEIVKTYVFHMLKTYVMILCNWLILWQKRTLLVFG